MTFPLKEELIYFEQLARRQHQIYPDAADFGVKITPDEQLSTRNILVELMQFYGFKLERWGELSFSHGSRTQVFIPIERDDDDREKYSGIVLDVSYNYDALSKIRFLSIDERREVLTPFQAKELYGCRVLS